jgi:aquaporin Z
VLQALKCHWPEYLIEATGLGTFMFIACAVGVILEYTDSPIHQALPDPFVRRVLFGLAMGLTAIGIIYSPWGKQSGAHINPCVTLTFYRLGKVHPWDACFYIASQVVGAVVGVLLAAAILGGRVAHPTVNYVVTVPGMRGSSIAFVAEGLISFGLMLAVLVTSNSASLGRWTGAFAGVLVATYITLEAPLSGMSMNPARTLGSAAVAHVWTSIWIYFTAPVLGMFVAAEAYTRLKGVVQCAKLHHANPMRCIFCEYQAARRSTIQTREAPACERSTADARPLP